MSILALNNVFYCPTIDFYYTATKRDYDNIAEFFGALTLDKLTGLGFSLIHAQNFMISVVNRMYLATIHSVVYEKRFVMPLSAITDIISILTVTNNLNDSLKELLNAFKSVMVDSTSK